MSDRGHHELDQAMYTPAGRRALREHVAALRAMIADVPGG